MMASFSSDAAGPSNSKRIKLSSSHQKVLPLIYECSVVVPNFSTTFTSVFEPADLSPEDKFAFISDEQFKVNTRAYANKSDVDPLDVFVKMSPKLLPSNHQGLTSDNQRLCLSLILYHYREVDNLAFISILLMGQSPGSVLRRMKAYATNTEFQSPRHKPTRGYRAEFHLSLSELWECKDQYLPDNTFRMTIQIGEDYSQDYRILPEVFINFSNKMRALLESGDRSDFTIKCGSTEFKTHEVILATQSPVFNAMLSRDMVEKKKRLVNIFDVDPHIFGILLEFIYTSQFEPRDRPFDELCSVIEASDKYQVVDLRNICFNYLSKNMSLNNIKELSQLAILAHRHSALEIHRKRISDFVADNFKTVRRNPDFKEAMKECLDLICDD